MQEQTNDTKSAETLKKERKKKRFKKQLWISLLLILLLVLVCAVTVWARAGGGGGGSSGGGGGGGSSSGGSYSGGSGRSNPLSSLLSYIIMIFSIAGASIIFFVQRKKAKMKSKRQMTILNRLGDNWDHKDIQKQVEKGYFIIQECWRRKDITYGAEYLSERLKEEWITKLAWMDMRNEVVIQKHVKLLSAEPVFVVDKEGTDGDYLWYLIHGRMTGYYVDGETGVVVRGNTMPESFYEYWIFIFENGHWVLDEIKQKDEVDISQFAN
jgi:predicted nucleic acid-binding Zn ribbon protein